LQSIDEATDQFVNAGIALARSGVLRIEADGRL
jgi:hypothetical protein